MSRDLTSLATRYAGRPLLLTPRAADELANRVRAVDHGATVREGRLSALIRKLGSIGRQPSAMEDDNDAEAPTFGERAAYAPRYIGDPDDYGFCWSLKDGVALMNVEGPLLDRGEYFCGVVYHGYDTILAALQEAAADERVKAVFIRMASPGGVVAGGLPALAEWMRENGARTGGKPIWVYADMACSAGYWLASASDRIVAPRVGLVGSIGAVIVHENWSKALEEMGVEITPIQFGAKKTDGAWWEALSDSAREDLQAEIDQCGRDFVADVIAGRPQLGADEVIATEARVFMGHHDDAERSGLALKLIDAHASEEAAFNELRDQVANASAPATGSITADAPRGRASASAAQEADMANKPKAAGKPTAAVAAAQAAVRKAQAELARAQAAAAEDGEPGDENEEDADTPPEAAGEGAEPSAAEGDEDAPEGETDEDADDAKAIAASAEAKSHPAMAMAAIASGQTLSQFKANVAAAGGANGGRNQLASTLGGSPRVGADGQSTKSAPRSAAAAWKANREAGLKQGR